MSKLDAFDAWRVSEVDQAAFMQRVAGGETPKAVCEAMGLPHTTLMRHVKSTPSLNAEYRAALETWVEALAHETVSIADGVEGAQEASEVAAAKLRCDTRFRIASKLYREMFGEDVKPNVSVNISLVDVAHEISELEARLGIGLAQPHLAQPRLVAALPEAQEAVEAEPPI